MAYSVSNSNILIVGGGLAGLFCALKLAPRPVTIVAAAPLGEGASTAWAQGGIAAAVAEGDTPEAHARDTVAAGAGIVDETVALGIAREAADRVHDLLSYGVPFDKDLEGRLLVSREAAHSTRRIVRVQGDRAGHAIMAALIEAVRKTPSIHVMEGFMAEELATVDNAVIGLHMRDQKGRLTTLPADTVVLATGGIGHLYSVTTNPAEARGVGLAIAARAGAVLADTEFVQFHPTALDVGRDPAPLATEALRGDGATLVNRAGERFMRRLHPDAELAPRDIVARGLFAEIAAGRGAFLDARQAIGADFQAKFPTVYASCMAAGIDPARQLIPVAPAAHYHMGGIAVDARGRASLAGLWAAGEVASSGAHGANRLASNSLLEAVVFASRIAEDIDGMEPGKKVPSAAATDDLRASSAITSADDSALRAVMSAHVGVIRDEEGLSRALAEIMDIERKTASPVLRNMATAALLVTATAWKRRESRGAHFRSDYQSADPAQAHRSFITLDEARHIAERAAVAPVPVH
ncbi:MAG: L-aspartate oxidase [Alphaproteobacteria bacterium]|jgi:L-aspartate oxidase|nr:L-aspartate oxidase [Alphaproteobacteria bacterium]